MGLSTLYLRGVYPPKTPPVGYRGEAVADLDDPDLRQLEVPGEDYPAAERLTLGAVSGPHEPPVVVLLDNEPESELVLENLEAVSQGAAWGG